MYFLIKMFRNIFSWIKSFQIRMDKTHLYNAALLTVTLVCITISCVILRKQGHWSMILNHKNITFMSYLLLNRIMKKFQIFSNIFEKFLSKITSYEIFVVKLGKNKSSQHSIFTTSKKTLVSLRKKCDRRGNNIFLNWKLCKWWKQYFSV